MVGLLESQSLAVKASGNAYPVPMMYAALGGMIAALGPLATHHKVEGDYGTAKKTLFDILSKKAKGKKKPKPIQKKRKRSSESS